VWVTEVVLGLDRHTPCQPARAVSSLALKLELSLRLGLAIDTIVDKIQRNPFVSSEMVWMYDAELERDDCEAAW
jgi:hypothetical protein